MPRHCSAGGCKSRDNRATRNAGITFHKLPKGATRRKLWITNSHRADYWDPQTDFVYFCSKHFTPDSFELTGCSGIRRLKEDAFPTVFVSSSTTICKRQGTLQKQEDIPVRKNPRSDIQEKAQQETDNYQTSKEPTIQKSVAAVEESNLNLPASSQEPSGMEYFSQHECSPTSAPVSRPLSPSRYMRRLPRPPGFYLPKEHSYAQLCPLLWRRRYDQAIDCLEKALRQLHAARRRENRLRSTVLRLHDKRLKHTYLVSQHGFKNRGNWTQVGEGRRGKGGSSQEEIEIDAISEDRYVDQTELGNHFLPATYSWSQRENGYCFYCGRGQAQVGSQVAQRILKTGKDVQPTVHKDSLQNQRLVETSTYGTVENAKDTQIVRLKSPPGKSIETIDSNSKGLLQTQGPQHMIPAEVSVPDTHEQSLQFLDSQQKLLSDNCEVETEAFGQGHHLDLKLQQLLWIQESLEGQVILVPVPSEDGLQSVFKTEGVPDEAQTILVSELNLKRDVGHMTENSGVLSRVLTTCDDEHRDQHSVINTTLVEMGEDVREKLKEHLEGFHLQLSTEFIN
ncbi:THAP domain-containing protein 7 [Anoplopoma fimbria]|uniref:THAP domain-containing protein 7 n=1 Tax=Anoplopoma fimbria TaxID=229290 RepID=UPI0023EACFA5|nr:THAP domain-containing protein 7 [Anoplopoma fimbria]